MEQFLKKINELPEIRELVGRVEEGGCPAEISGLAPVHRAIVGAAVAQATERPAVFVCGDEREAHTLCGDLHALTGTEPVLLLAREWQFRPNAVSSRSWEQSRLAALDAMARGKARTVVATVDGLMARTLPKKLLASSEIVLKAGGTADPAQLAERLVSAGYARCQQVEGVGQFALRGGILDVFSPLMEQPVRCEFFDDEIDSLGVFDPGTQRRVKNVKSARILPAAEVLPCFADGGAAGLADRLEKLAAKLAKRQKTETITEILREDSARLRSGAILGGADRYLAAIYPAVTSGVDYLPHDAVVFLCESGRLEERVKNTLLQIRQDTEALMEAGMLAGDCAKLTLSDAELYAALAEFPGVMEDSACPPPGMLLRPRALLSQ
jgi:transcription-repair coupling factor (superfamily II helicase)